MGNDNFELDLKTKAKAEAMVLAKETGEVILKRLTKLFGEFAAYGVEVTKNLFEMSKESVKGKTEAQKEYIKLCNGIIENCNQILKDGNVTEEEKLELLKTINNALEAARESDKSFQADQTKIAQTAIVTLGGVTLGLSLFAIVAKALAGKK